MDDIDVALADGGFGVGDEQGQRRHRLGTIEGKAKARPILQLATQEAHEAP